MARCPPPLRLQARSLLLRQLDHVDRRRVSPVVADLHFKPPEFPNRRGSRPATVHPLIEFKAGFSALPVDIN
jgi:hypothetical protein